jgi:tetratricopeptide (TPR) repeat protein
MDSLVFISVPESFAKKNALLRLNPAIPLPLQKQSIDSPDNSGIKLDGLTSEMIFAGILTVLAYDCTNAHTEYYRNLLLEARPGIKQELAEAAILKARNENFEIAEELFASLHGLDPNDMAIILNTAVMFDQRADSYRKSGLTPDADASDAEALALYKSAMDAEPAIPDAFFNAGFFYLKKQDYAQAKDCFETYLALVSGTDGDELDDNLRYKIERSAEVVNNINSQNLDDAKFKQAFELVSKGEEENGIELVRQFLQSNPDVWNAWFLLGWGLRRLERWADAKSAFLQAIEHGASDADTYNEIAICCMELEEFDASEKFLLKALSLENENTKIMSNIGVLAYRRGKTDEALSWFYTALEYDPDDLLAKQMIGNLEVPQELS